MNPLVDAPESRSWYVACMHSPAWDKTQFRRLLHLLMKQTGMGQQDVASAAGISRSQVSRWQSAAHRPNYDALTRLAAAVRRDHPAVTDIADSMVAAAGYELPGADAEASQDGGYSLTGLSADEVRILRAYIEGMRRGGATPPSATNGKTALPGLASGALP